MTNKEYGSREADTARRPSGGTLANTINGLGKFAPGSYKVTVLAVTPRGPSTLLLLEGTGGHCHSETVAWVPSWIRPGAKLGCLVEPTDGFVVVRDGEQYQAVDARTKEPYENYWYRNLFELYQTEIKRGRAPASTEIVELAEVSGGERFKPKVQRDPAYKGPTKNPPPAKL